jgi:hypothetical protein
VFGLGNDDKRAPRDTRTQLKTLNAFRIQYDLALTCCFAFAQLGTRKQYIARQRCEGRKGTARQLTAPTTCHLAVCGLADPAFHATDRIFSARACHACSESQPAGGLQSMVEASLRLDLVCLVFAPLVPSAVHSPWLIVPKSPKRASWHSSRHHVILPVDLSGSRNAKCKAFPGNMA